VANAPSLDTSLKPLNGEARPLREWLTTFHLTSIVIDPYTNESSWILKTAGRILHEFSGAATRVNFVVTSSEADAKKFLGPSADEYLTFTDPDRVLVKQLALTELPAFVFIQSDGTVPQCAQGWSPKSWREVSDYIADTVKWSRPLIPAAGDPGTFKGTPALV
jgi:hypothetical protein